MSLSTPAVPAYPNEAQRPKRASASIKRRIARALAVLMLCAGFGGSAVAITASPANAAINWPANWSWTWSNSNGGWTNVRTCADTRCGIVEYLYNGSVYSHVKMLCYTDGQWAYGNYWTNRWFYVYTYGGRYGYVHASLVQNQQWSPHC